MSTYMTWVPIKSINTQRDTYTEREGIRFTSPFASELNPTATVPLIMSTPLFL